MRIAGVAAAVAADIVLASSAFAQTSLLFSADYAIFKGPGRDKSNLEIYYSVPRSRLTYRSDPTTGMLSGALIVGMKMTKDGVVMLEDLWKLDARVADSVQLASDQYIVDQRRFSVDAGNYHLSVFAVDSEDPQRKDSVFMQFPVPSRTSPATVLSDIQLGSAISPSQGDSTDKFVKGVYRIVPHPRRTFGPDFPVLFFYGEIYNAAPPALTEDYQVHTCVVTETGQRVESAHDRTLKKRRVSESFAEVGHANVGSLPTGAYDFRMEILDDKGTMVARSSKKFYVYNAVSVSETPTPAAGDLFVGQFAGMTESELVESFDQVRSFARDDEVRTFEGLEGQIPRQKFMQRFWQVRDPDPSTPENESFTQFRERLDVVRQQYAWFNKPAWRTDRGRIYLAYGRPDEVERYPNEEDVRPYEIWHYNELQGGVIFVFGDRSNNGDYVLVHSTARGHLNDPDWILRLRVSR